MAFHPIIRDEFIHNLRVLIRLGFPNGLPLDSLKLAYSTNHPDCTVPTPKLISPDYEDWPDVFNKSVHFKEWFHMDSSNSIIFVLSKPEPDLFALSQLVSHDHLVMMKGILEQKTMNIKHKVAAVTATADPGQSKPNSLPTPAPVVPDADASQHQQIVEDVDAEDNQSVQSLTGEKNLESDLTTASTNEREGTVKVRPMEEILETCEDSEEYTVIEEILGEEAGNSSSSSSPTPKVTTTKVAPSPPNPVAATVTKNTPQNRGEKRKIQTENEKPMIPSSNKPSKSVNSVPVAGPSNTPKPVPISRKRSSKELELEPRNTNTPVTKASNKRPPLKKPGKERLESLLDISIPRKDFEKYRRKSEESPKRNQKKPPLLETPPTERREEVAPTPRRPKIHRSSIRSHRKGHEPFQSDDVDLRNEDHVREELLQMFTPGYCQLCGKTFYVERSAANHYACFGHRNKVQEYLDERGVKTVKPDDLQYTGYLNHAEDSDPHSQSHQEPHAYPVPRDPNALAPFDARHNLNSRRIDYPDTGDMDHQLQSAEWQEPRAVISRTVPRSVDWSWSWQRECYEIWYRA